VTTDSFLNHFNLDSLDDLPGVGELRAAGLLDARQGMLGFDIGEADAQAEGEEASAAHAEPDDETTDPDA
jgi:segregation and condensation protein B